MEALIPMLPVLAPLINFILVPMYHAIQKRLNDLQAENNRLREQIYELEVTMNRDFCRRGTCANFAAAETLNRRNSP